MQQLDEAAIREGIQELERRCERAGLPVTIQRRAVYEALLPRNDHPTVEELFHDVRAKLQGVSKATIYRALETLGELGLARKVPHPGSAVRFDPHVEPHHHFLCESCGAISDHLDARLRIEPPATSFEVHEASVLFLGKCERCSAA